MDQALLVGIYHKDCIDGTGAAAVLLAKFPDIQLFPLPHKYSAAMLEPIKQTATGSDLYFVDCAIGIDELIPLADKVTVIDHHIGIKEKLDALATEGKITYFFDNDKSGASLAWSTLFPDEPIPEMITYIEDADLWRWTYTDTTKYVNNYLSMYMNNPEGMLVRMSADVDAVKKDGAIISAYADYNIEKMAGGAQALHVRIGEHVVPAYNITIYESAIGNRLSREIGSAVMLYTIQGSRVHCHFRGQDGQAPSAFHLAQTLGGGGHRNAAGADIALKQFIGMMQ